MTKICRICKKEFEPHVHNATICYNSHYIKCRICGKQISLDGKENKLKRKMYLERGYAYCSKLCSNKGIGLDKQAKAEDSVDMNKLKYYVEQTPLPITDIAKIFNVSIDFVWARCKSNNFVRNSDLKEQSIKIKNNTISKALKNKYKDKDVKQNMLQKQKDTYKQKTGYEYSFKNPECQEKSRNTKLDRYGNSTYTNPQKMIKTRIIHNKGSFWTKEQIEQGMNTRIKLYGSNSNKAKIKQTNLHRHGVEWWCNPEKIRLTWNKKSDQEKQSIVHKQRTTCIKRYGVDNPSQTIQIQNKIKQTNLEKYGVDNPFKCPKIQNKIKQTNLEKYGTIYPVTLFSYLNNKTISKINKQTNNKLQSLNCDTQLEFSVNNYIYDILVKPNILIEINPTYTHNSTIGPIFKNKQVQPKEENYHLQKTLNALNNEYKCLHIFDWDDIDKICYSLQPKTKLYGRQCKLQITSLDITKDFLNKYHFQNSCNGQTVCIGLFFKDELVQIMTFGNPRYNKNYQWELLRLCTNPKYYIVGGAQKLFKYFKQNYNPKSIISYCDKSKFSGDIYSTLGFTLLNTSKPSKHWYNMKTKRHITDNLLRQRGYSQLHNDNNYVLYNKGDSNEKLMFENGYVIVYDCGQSTYIWNNNI